MDKFTLCLSVNPEDVAEPPLRLRLGLLLIAAAHLTIVLHKSLGSQGLEVPPLLDKRARYRRAEGRAECPGRTLLTGLLAEPPLLFSVEPLSVVLSVPSEIR